MPVLGGGRRTIGERGQILTMYAPRPEGEEPPSISDSMIQNYSMTSSRDGDWETSLPDDRVRPHREGLDRFLNLGQGSAVPSDARSPAAPSRPSIPPSLQPLDLRLAALLNESQQQLRETDEKFREAVLLKRRMAQIYGIDDSSKSLPNDLTPPALVEVNVVPPTPPVGRPLIPPPPTDELPQFLEFAEPDSVIFASLSSPARPPPSVLPRLPVKGADISPITWEQTSEYDGLTDASIPSLPPIPPLSDDSQDLISFEQSMQTGQEGGKATELQADDTFEIPLEEIAKWENLCDVKLPSEPDDSADWKLTNEMKHFWAERTARKAQEKLDKEATSRTKTSKARESRASGSKEEAKAKAKDERGKGKENLGVCFSYVHTTFSYSSCRCYRLSDVPPSHLQVLTQGRCWRPNSRYGLCQLLQLWLQYALIFLGEGTSIIEQRSPEGDERQGEGKREARQGHRQRDSRGTFCFCQTSHAHHHHNRSSAAL